MNKSKVYFTNLRTNSNMTLLQKLDRLVKKAGIENIDFNEKFVAIKIHFGEPGNLAYLRPNYSKVIVDLIKSKNGKPFLTDCNTLYVGRRKNAIEHMDAAYENGYNPFATGCHVIIADGLKGTDEAIIPVEGGEYVKEAKIGQSIADSDIFISMNHFKGHESTGFGGALKNIGMGCGSRAGKKEQHNDGTPTISESKCRGCKKCQKECANNGLVFNKETKKMSINPDTCAGCGRCIGACNFDAIAFENYTAVENLNCRMAEYTKAVVDGRPTFHISLVVDVSPNCDCHAENDAPILPNIGMFASYDLLALDQACVDACMDATPIRNSQLGDNLAKKDFHDHHDHFTNSTPESEWKTCLSHAEKIGLGSRDYELVVIK